MKNFRDDNSPFFLLSLGCLKRIQDAKWPLYLKAFLFKFCNIPPTSIALISIAKTTPSKTEQMNDFIGNNIKTIVEWGQLTMAIPVLLGIIAIFFIVRKNKYYLPKGFFSWLGTIFLSILILFSSLVIARITVIKPGAKAIITQLDGLVGEKAPNLEFLAISDTSQKNISDYEGRVVLVNFWATWCRPCLKEMPDLNRLQKDYQGKGLTILAISDETMEAVNTYAARAPFDAIPGLVETFDWVDLGSERPATFLVDRDGIVREYFTGSYSYEHFEEKVLNYLD